MTLQLNYPLNGPITQYFGENPDFYAQWGYAGHNGIDFGIPERTPIMAAASGTVEKVGFEDGGYGNYVKLKHQDGGSTYFTYYAHMVQQSTLTVGKAINVGDVVGLSGNTGASTGPHLHFGLRTSETTGSYKGYIDPLPFLTGAATSTPTTTTTTTTTTPSSAPVTGSPTTGAPSAFNAMSGAVALPFLQFVVLTDNLNVRSGPGVTYGIVTTLKANKVVMGTKLFSDSAWIEFEAGKWCALTHAGVPNMKITGTGATVPPLAGASADQMALANWRFEVLANELNIRNGPGANFNLLGKHPKGTKLTAKKMSSQNLWIEYEPNKWCAAIFGGIQNLRTK